MNKKEFLQALQQALADFVPAERHVTADYYAEMIDERIEAGMAEEEAVADIGTPGQIAAEIRQNAAPSALLPPKQKPRIGLITLLILGSPIWFSLLLALGCVTLAVYILLWSVILVLWAIVPAMLFTAVCCFVVTAVEMLTQPMTALLYLGTGAAATGIGLLMLLVCKPLTVLFAKVSAKLMRLIIQKCRRKAVNA